MQKLRTVIVDDEPLAREFLRLLLASFDDVEVVAECSNGKEAVATTLELRPQLLFLDIQMPGMNGFEVVKTLQSDIMPMAIFVTAFNQYAVDAFDLHAVDYVLKPLDAERIRRSVDRALDRLKSQSDTNFKTPLIGAIDAISKRMAADKPGDSRSGSLPDGMKRKLLVRDSGVVKVIPFDDIDWVDAAGDYMCVHAAGETHVIRSTLRELKAKLDDKLFVQIHRSTIVNVERVVSVTPLQKGGSLLHLSDGGSLKVSRNYRESIRNLFQ
ncbi:LytTR family DNA-binding domain-containing protein [Porticoccaceae bacterium]|nr:LytTR family DNA-binding domain-containing protein [Porticoccaceae bacterium]MDA8936589.1 LytTR family DNA-binding domain-containing protein [Porticoccaceae bacterium]